MFSKLLTVCVRTRTDMNFIFYFFYFFFQKKIVWVARLWIPVVMMKEECQNGWIK